MAVDKKTEEEKATSIYSTMYSVFHFIIGIFALYLSFKCNKGFSADILFACCCPHLYIIYRFATSPDFCGLR
jgi:hypothetical protein